MVAAPNIHVSHPTVVSAVLSFAKPGVPHRHTDSPFLRVGSELGVVAINRLVVPAVTCFFSRTAAMQTVLGMVGPVTVVVDPLAKPGRLIRQADPPLAQARKPEVGGYCSTVQSNSVIVVVSS